MSLVGYSSKGGKRVGRNWASKPALTGLHAWFSHCSSPTIARISLYQCFLISSLSSLEVWQQAQSDFTHIIFSGTNVFTLQKKGKLLTYTGHYHHSKYAERINTLPVFPEMPHTYPAVGHAKLPAVLPPGQTCMPPYLCMEPLCWNSSALSSTWGGFTSILQIQLNHHLF